MRHTFSTAVFIIQDGRVLLIKHRRYGCWLPPGGHLEAGETPDAAALREVREETGLTVELCGERAPSLGVDGLVRPRGVQRRDAGDHVHIDLVYGARPLGGTEAPGAEAAELRWVAAGEVDSLAMPEDVRAWAALMLSEGGCTGS